MKDGQLDRAKRYALRLFDDWIAVTGVVEKDCGWYYEMVSIIEDAAEIGAAFALGAEDECVRRLSERAGCELPPPGDAP